MTSSVLLVDDHQLMREGLRSILEKEPTLEVVGEAASGREALRQVDLLGPDVVIMDVAMKDLNGIEATREIRRRHPEIAVVALSNHSDPSYVRAMLEARASAYVLKADAYDELHRAVQAALSGRTYVSQRLAPSLTDEVGGPRGSVYEHLGPREREVLQLVAEGKSNKEVAQLLDVAVSTVESHRKRIMEKLDLHNTAAMVRFAVRKGIVQ